MAPRLIYFIRHGETDWNAERRLQGQLDIPLNALGRRQSAHCAEVLRHLLAARNRTPEDFAFLSSPLRRARETMEIVRAGLRLAPQDYATDHRLLEMSFGRWEGLTFKEVKATGRGVLADRERDKWNFCPPEGESYAHLLARVQEWHGAAAGNVIVAAHGGVARVLRVLFGVHAKADAVLGTVEQGVVYELSPGFMDCHV
jgi:broad specificity phosphatase PhoE